MGRLGEIEGRKQQPESSRQKAVDKKRTRLRARVPVFKKNFGKGIHYGVEVRNTDTISRYDSIPRRFGTPAGVNSLYRKVWCLIPPWRD
jgi:hypothetical protein